MDVFIPRPILLFAIKHLRMKSMMYFSSSMSDAFSVVVCLSVCSTIRVIAANKFMRIGCSSINFYCNKYPLRELPHVICTVIYVCDVLLTDHWVSTIVRSKCDVNEATMNHI